MKEKAESCRREILAIEAELVGGLADWHVELMILQNEKRRQELSRRRGGDVQAIQALTE